MRSQWCQRGTSDSPPEAGTQGTSPKRVIAVLKPRRPEHKPKTGGSRPEAQRARTKDWNGLKPRLHGSQSRAGTRGQL